MDHLKLWLKKQQLQVQIFMGAVVCIALLGGGLIWQMVQREVPMKQVAEIASITSESTASLGEHLEASSDKEAIEDWKIDLKGAIKKPGVYSAKKGMRLMDIIELAGGFMENANQLPINLALRIEDQMVIYIPVVGEEIPYNEAVQSRSNEIGTPSTIHSEKGSDGTVEERVNLNTADVNELQTLNGIGLKKAEMIVQYRMENGIFQAIEDVQNISGIGAKIFEGLKEQVTVG